MKFKAVGAFMISFILLSSLQVTTMDNDLDVDLTLNRSTPITCSFNYISSSAHLTCIFPYDIRQERLSFNVKTFHQTAKASGQKLALNCIWLKNLKCVGTNGSVPLREDQINTNATFVIPINDALLHTFTCHLTDLTIETHPCTLDVFENTSSPAGNETAPYQIAVIALAVVIAFAATISILIIVIKRRWRKEKCESKENGEEIENTNNEYQTPNTQGPSVELDVSLQSEQHENYYKIQQNPDEALPLISKRQSDENDNQNQCLWKPRDTDDNTQPNTDKTVSLYSNSQSDKNDDKNSALSKPSDNANTESFNYEKAGLSENGNTQPKTDESVPLLSRKLSFENAKSTTLLKPMDNAKIESFNIWKCLENLCERSVIIPETYFTYVHTNPTMIGQQKVDVIDPTDHPVKPTNPIRQRISDVDETNRNIHTCLSKVKQQFSPDELMVILTQTSFSLYGAGASEVTEVPMDNLEQTLQRKEQFSDLVVINKQRGILGGIVFRDYITNPALEEKLLKISTDKVLKCSDIIKELLSKVSKAEEVAVHTTLVLPNITRKQFQESLSNAFPSVPCLFKDDMDTNDGVRNWWNACWESGDSSAMDVDVYRNLVYTFAVPAMRVETKLTNDTSIHRTNYRDTKATTSDIVVYDQTELSRYLLFPSQEKLLDYDSLDEAQNDITILIGPQGTGKSKLLRLRAQQWVSHFAASNIIILQTTKDGTAAACVLEHQLEQMLHDQKCFITPVDLSELCERKNDFATCSTEGKVKETLQMKLGLLKGFSSDAAIHIVADEAYGNVVKVLYEWLTETSQAIIRMWAAGVKVFENMEKLPTSLQHATVHITEQHIFHGPLKQRMLRMKSSSDDSQSEKERELADGQPFIQLRHTKGRGGHDEGPYPWRCAQCATNIFQQLKQLLVGEADKGCQGLSANDVFILGRQLSCEDSDVNKLFSPVPLIKCLQENGCNVCTVNSDSTRDYIMSIIKKTNRPPAITISNEKYLWDLKRKVIVYCESSSDADVAGKLRALCKTTHTLIDIKPE